MINSSATSSPVEALSGQINQNIEAVAALQARAEQRVSRYQRTIEAATALLGRPAFLYLIQLFVLVWVLVNLYAHRLHVSQFDPPPFNWLQDLVSLGALLMTTVVLITQNRQGKLDQRREQLDLQVNLLTEQKVAKLIALVEELRRDLPSVHNRADPEAEALKEAVNPHSVVAALEETLGEFVIGEAAPEAEGAGGDYPGR